MISWYGIDPGGEPSQLATWRPGEVRKFLELWAEAHPEEFDRLLRGAREEPEIPP